MKDRLKLSDNYFIDDNCLDLVRYHLVTFIINKENVERDKKRGIDIYLSNPLKAVYKRHYYWITIVRDKSNYYWYMRGYNNKNFIIKTDEDTDNFDIVLTKIME